MAKYTYGNIQRYYEGGNSVVHAPSFHAGRTKCGTPHRAWLKNDLNWSYVIGLRVNCKRCLRILEK